MVTYNETETQETQSPFGYRNSATTLDNQLDFSSTMPSYSNYTSYETPTIESEEEQVTPSYEVEREYNIESLPEDEVIIPTFMPTLNASNPETVRAQDYKIKLNARGKIIASVFGVVVSLLIAFMIYNAVIISKLSNSLKYLEADQASKVSNIAIMEANYQDITSYKQMELNAVDQGFTYSEPSQDIKISLDTRPEIKSAPESTNWFNNLCEFFSEMFN